MIWEKSVASFYLKNSHQFNACYNLDDFLHLKMSGDVSAHVKLWLKPWSLFCAQRNDRRRGVAQTLRMQPEVPERT